MKQLLIATLLVLLPAGAALADEGAAYSAAATGAKLNVRTFQLKYKDADRAAGVIKSLLSAEGTMSIQPSSNALVVTDRAENLKAVATALSEFDAPAKAVKLTVRVVAASRAENPTRTPDELRDIAGKLAMLRFNSFETLGRADIEGREGENGLVELSGDLKADFRFGEYDPSSNSVKVNDFRLMRLQGANKDQLAQLYKATLNLKVGPPTIIGLARPEGQRAVMLVFSASH